MKLSELITKLNGETLCAGDGEREITGVIVGDLLSHIIGEADEGMVWVTIQIHLNVSAVAVLKELPILVLASNRKPSEELLAKCAEEKIALVVLRKSAYEVCVLLHSILN